MRLRELLRSTTFRWALAIAGAFAACDLLLFGCFYLRTTMYLTGNIDAAVMESAHIIATLPPAGRPDAIKRRLLDDPRRVRLAGLFTEGGQRITGNIAALPANLTLDGTAQAATLVRLDASGREVQATRAAGLRLPEGVVLVVGHDFDEPREVAQTVGRGLMIQLAPALALALLVGVWLSVRAQRRIEDMGRQASRIVSGELQARLPINQSHDSLDRLAAIVNRMLDEIEMLVRQLAGVGDDIAHDLRTPLTRVRALLERGRDSAHGLSELQAVTDRAIAGLDQSLSIITALLRIAEFDQGRRLAAVEPVELAEILRAVEEFYDPIAEDKNIALEVATAELPPVLGDHDLLFEAVANLVDNAMKFTPPGGTVRIGLDRQLGAPVIRVSDTGPGISAEEHEIVTRRFYRADKSRGTDGIGLGLSVVAAIVRLHGFRLVIHSGPGCVVEIVCRRDPDAALVRPTARPVQPARTPELADRLAAE
jgi:signal transduction histidine kinase